MNTLSDAGPALTNWNYDIPTGLLTSKVDSNQKSTEYTYNPGTTLLKTRKWDE